MILLESNKIALSKLKMPQSFKPYDKLYNVSNNTAI